MKINKIVLITLLIIFVISIPTIILYKIESRFKVPKVESIQTVKIVPGKAGPDEKDELLFGLSQQKYRKSVDDILGWLKTGNEKGSSKDEFRSLGGTPTKLIIELKSGTTIEIISSVGYTGGKFPNRTFVQSRSIDGQVTIYDSNRKNGFRVYAPKLKSFIVDGWKTLFDYNY